MFTKIVWSGDNEKSCKRLCVAEFWSGQPAKKILKTGGKKIFYFNNWGQMSLCIRMEWFMKFKMATRHVFRLKKVFRACPRGMTSFIFKKLTLKRNVKNVFLRPQRLLENYNFNVLAPWAMRTGDWTRVFFGIGLLKIYLIDSIVPVFKICQSTRITPHYILSSPILYCTVEADWFWLEQSGNKINQLEGKLLLEIFPFRYFLMQTFYFSLFGMFWTLLYSPNKITEVEHAIVSTWMGDQ